MCHENMQVEFEIWSGQIISGRVMPLGLRKIPLYLQFPLIISITNWHFKLKFVYRCVTRIRRLSLNLGQVELFFGRIIPHALFRKIPIMCHKNTQVKFRYASIEIIFSNVMHLALMYLGVRQFLTSLIF